MSIMEVLDAIGGLTQTLFIFGTLIFIPYAKVTFQIKAIL